MTSVNNGYFTVGSVSTLAFDIGDDGDEDRLMVAATVGQAATRSDDIAVTGFGYKYAAATKIKAYVQTAAATAVDGGVDGGGIALGAIQRGAIGALGRCSTRHLTLIPQAHHAGIALCIHEITVTQVKAGIDHSDQHVFSRQSRPALRQRAGAQRVSLGVGHALVESCHGASWRFDAMHIRQCSNR